jgi:hypothetical protein
LQHLSAVDIASAFASWLLQRDVQDAVAGRRTMKQIKEVAILIVLALGAVLLLPQALDAATELLDRLPAGQTQQQITVQVVMPTAVPAQINESLLTAVAQPETAVPATPTAVATLAPQTIQQNETVLSTPQACGRRGCPGGRPTATPGRGGE